jgi:hypothetical protein
MDKTDVQGESRPNTETGWLCPLTHLAHVLSWASVCYCYIFWLAWTLSHNRTICWRQNQCLKHSWTWTFWCGCQLKKILLKNFDVIYKVRPNKILTNKFKMYSYSLRWSAVLSRHFTDQIFLCHQGQIHEQIFRIFILNEGFILENKGVMLLSSSNEWCHERFCMI